MYKKYIKKIQIPLKLKDIEKINRIAEEKKVSRAKFLSSIIEGYLKDEG